MAYQSKYTGLQIDDILDSVEWKQGKIEDLASIRAGAQKGATALQSYTEKYTGTVTGIKINGVVKSGSGVIDLGTISTDISGKVDKVAGKQLSTEDFTTALKTKLEGLSNYDDTELSDAIETLRGDFDNIVSGDTTTAIKTFNEVIAFLDGLTDTQDLESIIANIEQQIAGKMDKVTLAKVATSGSYNDLSNKPTIPAAVTESTVSGWGFTKNAGTYSKPSGGIPKSDLASAVQTSLGKADTALQSYTEQYKGTITGVSANGTSIATSGVANIPAASTSKYGVTKLSSATNSTSTTLAATASAVKAAYDLANNYKGTVTGVKINGATKSPTSGTVDIGNVVTSIKINGSTKTPSSGVVDLGTISGGGSSGGSGAYSEVNHRTSDTTFALTPNTFHVWDEVANLTLTLGSETSGVANEYLFQFTSGATATTLSLPSDLKWTEELAIEPNMIYQVSILKGLASCLEFSNTIELKDNFIDIQGNELVFQYPTTSELSINVYGRTTGMPSNHEIVVPSGSSSYVASDLSTILYINSVSPSSDSTYKYTFQMT